MTGKDVVFPGPDVGYEFEPLELLVTAEMNQQYVYAEEDYNPIYLEETEQGPPLIHPALILNMSNDTRSPSFSMPPGTAGLHARDVVAFCNPARLGKKLIMRWKIIEKYAKRERPYKVVETLVFDEDGVQILRRLQHVTMTTGKAGSGQR